MVKTHVMTSSGKITAGIDVGSRTTKALLWNGKEAIGRSLISTGWLPEQSARKAFDEARNHAEIDRVDHVVVTGYGRVSAKFADQSVTEITAHARGVAYLNPGTRTLIDIGGQDSKAIILDEEGFVQDFAMNDRCAAGSGKFLEFLAMTMTLPV